jgi:hypothetical protein
LLPIGTPALRGGVSPVPHRGMPLMFDELAEGKAMEKILRQ